LWIYEGKITSGKRVTPGCWAASPTKNNVEKYKNGNQDMIENNQEI
jgi:hypothetical protein